ELCIEAIRLGKIQDVGLPVARDSDTSGILYSFHDWVFRLKNRCSVLNANNLNEFCRTLCLDQESNDQNLAGRCCSAFITVWSAENPNMVDARSGLEKV